VDVEFLDGEMVVGRQALLRWTPPLDEYVFDGVTYGLFGFHGPTVQENGRQLFRVFVHPRATPTDPDAEAPEPAPS
jgi:hypothetical protein